MAQPPPGWQPAQYVLVPARPPAPPMSGLAVTGFVFSLVWGLGITAGIGLVLSAAALVTMRDGTRRGTGLAIAGVILGIVGTLTGFPFLYALTQS